MSAVSTKIMEIMAISAAGAVEMRIETVAASMARELFNFRR